MVTSRRSEQSLFLFCCVACLCLLTDAIDCRRFVFAPLCRGISAKRSAKISNDELRDLGDGDESWMEWAKPSSDEKDSNLRKRRESIPIAQHRNEHNLRATAGHLVIIKNEMSDLLLRKTVSASSETKLFPLMQTQFPIANQLLKELLEKFQDYAALREEDK